jgi:hypothetical protein
MMSRTRQVRRFCPVEGAIPQRISKRQAVSDIEAVDDLSVFAGGRCACRRLLRKMSRRLRKRLIRA